MHRIHRYIALGMMFFLPIIVYAGGRREIITQVADGMDIWQTEFDVSGMRPGTYNIIVNAIDAAGNTGVSGPFNIRIDPYAGLPEVRVVYPDQGQVIRGDINLIGTAAARFGVKQLYIKINDAEYIPIPGGEYWSYPIVAEDIGEGTHTISVKAVDSNDMEGLETTMQFIMDVSPPLIELISHEIGDLIAGRNVKVRGKVTDANGIQSLEISLDGHRFSRLSSSAGRGGDPARYFQFNIPTRKYEDGSIVYYIRAVNDTGFSDTRPFLFFVNNYAPVIEILAPVPGEDSFGITQVTGRVLSGVGLTEFYYEWQGQRHDIPLRPGDPFWAVDVHFSLANNRPVPFRITAVDRSGNVTVLTQPFQDRRNFRTPTLEIIHPPPPTGLGRMQLAHDQPIYGRILDGFFPHAISIESVVEYAWAQPFFRIDPWQINEAVVMGGNAASPNNTLRFWALNEETQMGDVVNLRISRAPQPEGFRLVESLVEFDSPVYWDDDGNFTTPWVTDSVTFEGFIDEYTPGQVLEYRFRWDDPWKTIPVTAGGEFSLTLSLANYADGPIPMEFRTIAGDRADYPVFAPINKYSALPSISFLTPHEDFGIIQRATTASGIIDYTVPLAEVSFSIDGEIYTPLDFTARFGRAWFHEYIDFTTLNIEEQVLVIRAVDRAGNVVEASPVFTFDNSEAMPIVIHNSPNDGDLITGDFTLSGLAYVDVGIAAVYYRILTPVNPWDSVETTLATRRRDVEFDKIETTQNYYIPLEIWDVRDGYNILEIFAEDIFGIQGHIITRTFQVSTAAPDIVVLSPEMDQWNRRNTLVRGTAFDQNGIEDVRISMDNGVSWQRPDFGVTHAVHREIDTTWTSGIDFDGTVWTRESAVSPMDASPPSRQGLTEWSISLNTAAYHDGIHSMLIRSVDTYGVTAFTSAIINIDNTLPTIDLGSPGNGESFGLTVPITGQVFDGIGLDNITIQVVNINDPAVQIEYALPEQFVVMETLDVSAFPDGDYTVKVAAVDHAGNEQSIVRNFTLIKARAASEIAIMNPMPGIMHSGPLNVSGRITGAVIPERVTLMLNNRPYTNIDVNRYGVFRHEMPEDQSWMGDSVVFSAVFETPDGDRITSFDNVVRVESFGPVLVIDSHRDGDVITQRPWISGRAFMHRPEVLSPDEMNISHAVTLVEVSLDNGRTFDEARGTTSWRYRLETSELSTGTLPVVIKATFGDGSVAVRRIILTVDIRVPMVNTIGPTENQSFRDSVLVYGSAGDDFDMDRVEVSLRPGDKAGYAVPAFIQGLYIDYSMLGGLTWSTGLGLTFFDDNVKVQVNVSQAAPGRYSGWAFGGKILANIYNLNMSRLLGLDFEFWNTSLVVGAHFSYFLMEEGENPLWMGQFLGQWEIIKADMSYLFPKWRYFKSISLYTEPGIWFAPSDVVSDQAWRTLFTIAFGVRISLF